jgi:hypothetical protein
LVQLVNRFLYSIIEPSKVRENYSKGQRFIEDKSVRLEKAKHFFNDENNKVMTEKIIVPPPKSNEVDDIGNWYEDTRRVFTEKFKTGLNRTRVQMIRLADQPQYKVNLKLSILFSFFSYFL